MATIKKRCIALVNRLKFNITRPEMRVLPGQLSFFFFLTLIPLVALVGSCISLFDLPYNSINELLDGYFPKGTAFFLNIISNNMEFSFNWIIFFVSSLFLASNATDSMIIASNQIYKIEDKPYIKRRAKAFFMMIILFVLLLFVLLIPVFGDMIFKLIGSINDVSGFRKFVVSVYHTLKYPLSFLFIFGMIKLIYIMAPDKKIKRSQVNYGSLFTAISWTLVNQFYSIYIEKFTNYTTFYGSVASLLILLLWLYLLSYIFVLGMALNVTKYELDEKKNK